MENKTGGKTQLITEIEKVIPFQYTKSKFTYIEPFVGSGAILFWMINKFPNMEKAVINDINEDLINTYKIIASKPKELISILEILQNEYHLLDLKEIEKREYYYEKREIYNSRNTDKCTQAALFIFLNRTCFNGLYRVNKNNLYNVPTGIYKKPTICNSENILAVSNALQKVEILSGDYQKTIDFVNQNTLFYFDPPYKPLSKTSSFNSYAKDEFDDLEQIRLRDFCAKLNLMGHNWILSNSDVKGKDMNDNFFDDLYSEFNICRVDAKRSINANPDKRGKLSELLITNNHPENYIPTNDFIKKSFSAISDIVEKVNINKIKIDRTLFSFDNNVSEYVVERIVNSFDLSFWEPIAVDNNYYLRDGQHRLEAAKRMNLSYLDIAVLHKNYLIHCQK